MITWSPSRHLNFPVTRLITEMYFKLFSPVSLFSSGEQGLWYDPSDLSTLFQDAVGAIPVTAAGQPVGLMLDKRLGLVGVGPKRNLVTYSQEFDNAAWLKNAASVTANTFIAPDGTLTADTITFSSSGGYLNNSIFNFTATIGQKIVISIHARTPTQIQVIGGSTATGTDVYSYVDIGGGWYRQSVERTFTETTSAKPLQVVPAATFVGAGSFVVWGAQADRNLLTPYQLSTTGTGGDWTPGNHASQTTAASKPILRNAGGLWYLDFDGVDDFLFASDNAGLRDSKMSLFVGVNPLSLGSREDWFACGNSTAFDTNNYIIGNSATGVQLLPRTPAAVTQLTTISASAPVVVSITSDNAQSLVRSRLNGVQLANKTATFGTDNTTGFFIGKSSSAGFSSAMYLFGLVVRGAATDATGITNTEKFMGAKSGVTL